MPVTDRNLSCSSTRSTIILHGIGAPQRPLETGEEVFWISRDQLCRTLDQILSMEDDAPEITFDDGNVSDIEIALPELSARQLRATFFLLTARLNTAGSLRSDDVRTLVAAGHRIGLHGHAHVDWRKLDSAGRSREFVTARDCLSKLAGHPVEVAAAPFGLYNRQTVQDLRNLGFRALYTSDRGVAHGQDFIRPRNCLEGRMNTADIDAALRGHVAPLRRARRLVGITRKRLLPLNLRL